ncbi:MAG: hypothetical protein DDT20_01641 [Firmicutes bacterium]|nr:hypothetical protein [Bacillota bacterium]
MRPPYSARDLVKLYVYGEENGITSSRKLEAETKRNLEVMWLLRGLHPDHKTIAEFRRKHPEPLRRAIKAAALFWCASMRHRPSVVVDAHGTQYGGEAQ